jgi:exopolysaccharide/PEP-CTERM locus tyrosine autokinase
MSTHSKGKSSGTISGLVAVETIEDPDDFRSPGSQSNDDTEHAGSVRMVPDRVLIEDRLRVADMLVPGSRLGPGFLDEYRRLKRPLLSNAFGKTASLVDRGNLILVTSAVPGEGKTHTAVNLALSIARELDHTVLLVDCDVAKQGASQILGLAGMPGLVDLLENANIKVSDVLLRTDIAELTVLCAGKQHEDVTELLASQRMSSLVDEMVSRYDDRVIIFDGPPLLPTPQAHVLAELVGQIVFVIAAGQTPQMAVDEALELVPDDKATGLVLNKAEGIQSHGGYYYGNYTSASDKKK